MDSHYSDRDNADEQLHVQVSRPQPLTQRTYQSIVDRRIAEAQSAGLFDDLPGVGKPLKLDDDSLVPEEDRPAYRLLKNAGFAPPWIELQKNIREERAALTAWVARINRRWEHIGKWERRQLHQEYRQRLVELNRLITHYNLIVPEVVGQMATLAIQDELAQLGAA